MGHQRSSFLSRHDVPVAMLCRGQAYVGAFLRPKEEGSSAGGEQAAADAVPAAAGAAQDGVTVEEPDSSEDTVDAADVDGTEGAAQGDTHHLTVSPGAVCKCHSEEMRVGLLSLCMSLILGPGSHGALQSIAAWSGPEDHEA